MEKKKSFKEEFAKFCEAPDRTKFRDLLKQNTGEYNHIDFKEKWLEKAELAKHILGLANSEGGVLVVGIKEESDGRLISQGLDSFEDKTDLKAKLQKYLPAEVEYEIHNFDYSDEAEWGPIKNKKFQAIEVMDTPQYIPFLSLNSFGDILHKNRVYYRGRSNTEEATYEELKKIINRRLDTNISTTVEDTFKEHISQLKVLYSFINKYLTKNPFWMLNISSFVGATTVKNPNYPDEDFEKFISRMISRKKEIIETLMRF